MKNIEKLYSRLDSEMNKVATSTSREQIQNCISNMNTKFGIPQEETSKYLTGGHRLYEASKLVLYAFSHEFFEKDIQEYFTGQEIEKLKEARYPTEPALDAIKVDAIRVMADQWIGAAKASQIIKWSNAGIINYNDRTQRAMERIISNGVERYRISVNWPSVKEIRRLMSESNYIPTPITLNVPPERQCKYDEKAKRLSLEIDGGFKLDLVDGYHRFLAMLRSINSDEEFDCDMELRIIQFSEEKARQFIWQEEQKNLMKKIDSDAMNMDNPASRIVDGLNQESVLRGEITPNKSTINSSLLRFYIDAEFFGSGSKRRKKKKNNMLEMLDAKKKIKERLNHLIEERGDEYSKQWSEHRIIAFVRACFIEAPLDEMHDKVKEYEKRMDENPDLFKNGVKTRYIKKEFDKLDISK